MSTISHEPATLVERPSWLAARNLWASVSIVAIWAGVVLTALFGPEFATISAGGNRTTIPSGIFVALFALFGTTAVAKYGFERKTELR